MILSVKLAHLKKTVFLLVLPQFCVDDGGDRGLIVFIFVGFN